MKRQILTGLLTVGFLSACGGEPNQTPDAGEQIDTSCGIDCAAQEQYGLIANRCFEYSATNNAQEFPEVGVFVGPMKTLEGGVKVMPVEYRQNGLLLMTDSFTIKDGDLYLARREFKPGQSVTYKDADNKIVGVPWFRKTTEANQNFSATVTADVVNADKRTAEETTFSVNTRTPTNLEKTMAAGEFPDAITLAFAESPEHGADSRRVLSRGTGFVVFATNFQLNSNDSKLPKYLQKVRNIAEGDPACGIGQ